METTKQEYLNKKQSDLFDSLGCFYAFSKQQFTEGLKNAGGIKKMGKYTNITAGLVCPEKNVSALLRGLDEIKKDWETDRKKVDQIKLKFIGIDNWNRPVWKAPDKKKYYGSVNELFSYGATKEEVLKKVDTYGLCYFGDHFGCEPMGTKVPDKYYI